ncbi:hypothetical protein BDN72DRAFT_410195 [Pluteus cervinus]|uniref:Uncharacterized protein n=1 Tax=Pluteus cervinus TaxID=181527 RepID=A0ACD3B210_9AGAR|nr:hypothetical protein BDN72DRAFT_410195 [Pluteus cervinus]
MADVIDLLHINDITVMRTLDPEDDLADWKDTKLLARVLIDDELLDEGGACLPIVYEGQGARPVTRWELGGIQVPTDCIPLTLIITTTGHFEIFRFEIERGLDGIWHTEMVKSEKICLRFRAQVFLYHPLSCFHQEYHTTPEDDLIQWDIHPAEPWDERIGSLDRILGFPFLSAGQLVLLGVQHYTAASRSHGDNRRLEHALAAFERALQDPNLDPGLSQIVETVIPFLYCLIQGYTSCLDIALQVLQTFPDLQLGAEVPYAIVLDIVRRFEWHDYIPLAIKLVTGPLKHLLHSASPDTRFVEWVTLAYRLAPSAKEVLPLMDLMVDFHSGFPSSEGFALPMMRATIYFRRSIQPGRPSLGMTLGAAEFAMHSLAGREHSPHLGPTECQFIQWSFSWLLDVLSQDLAESKPYKDRLVSFVAWQLSHFPLSPRMQGSLRAIQSRLRGNIRMYAFERVKLSQPPILDDNDKQFIEECDQDLLWQKSGNEISVPTEYPRGAAELVRNLLMDADSGLGVAQLSCGIAATVAYALRLPEAFKVYSLFMGCLEESILSDRSLVGALRGPDVIHLVLRDAISCASETGNHASALQWSDQGCSQIWNWLFHSRLSIGQSFATEPVVARKLKTRPPWIGSWAKHQQDKLERNHIPCRGLGWTHRLPHLQSLFLSCTRRSSGP